MNTYFRLLTYARPIGKFAIPYVLFTILAVLFGAMNLALLAPLINVLFLQPDLHAPLPPRPDHFLEIFKAFDYYSRYYAQEVGVYKTLQIVCLVIIVSVLLANVFRYLAARSIENLRIQTLYNLRNAVFKNVMDLHLAYFTHQRKGNIISKIASDVQVVQYSVTGTLQVIFKEPLTLIAYLVMLFMISYKLTLASLVILPLAAFLISRIVKKLKEQARASHESYGTMISYLDEALHGMRVIKALNAAKFITGRFEEENENYSKISRAMVRRQQLAAPVSEFFGILMVACIMLYGGYLVLHPGSGLTAVNFIAYIALYSQIIRPAKAISSSFVSIHSGLTAGERVLELIDEQNAIPDATEAKPLMEFSESIELKNISFRYGDAWILKNISMSLPKGKIVALVGPSGGGKSTLMDLLPRFIEPQSGSITIDGGDLRSYTIDSLRNKMGIVNQESILFNDSIARNIAFGKKDYSMAEVEAAARIANAHEFILAMESGYDTNIGDRGIKLSGGQKQRICIARAVFHNPEILLLDEATSALDTESEKAVQDALNNLMVDRTTLVIAHRLSTVKHADHIIVLDDGEIIEQGTHQSLVLRNGLYSRLIEMQSLSGEKQPASVE